MKLHTIRVKSGAIKNRKRLGRGNASGHGTFSGRGCKGQGQHGNKNPHPGFEGGQTPLARRLPKLSGFTSICKQFYQIVNLRSLNILEDGTEVTPAVLLEHRLIRRKDRPVKILGDGTLKKKLTLKIHAISRSAKEQILKAGGKVL